KVRLIGESRRKDDRLDARTLARLARIDPQLLAPVKHRSAKAQADLTVIRARAGLVRARTSLINTARGLTKSYGERLRGCNSRNMFARVAMWAGIWDCNQVGGTRDRVNRSCTSARKEIRICGRCWCRVHTTFWGRLEPIATCDAGA